MGAREHQRCNIDRMMDTNVRRSTIGTDFPHVQQLQSVRAFDVRTTIVTKPCDVVFMVIKQKDCCFNDVVVSTSDDAIRIKRSHGTYGADDLNSQHCNVLMKMRRTIIHE